MLMLVHPPFVGSGQHHFHCVDSHFALLADPVPSGNSPLLSSHVTADLWVEHRGEVSQEIMASLAARADLALESMLSATIQRLSAESAVRSPVLARGAKRAESEAQAVLQVHLEVLVRLGLRHLVLKRNRRLEEPTSTRPSTRTKVHLVVGA